MLHNAGRAYRVVQDPLHPSSGTMFVFDDLPAPADPNTIPDPLVLELPTLPRVFADVDALLSDLMEASGDAS